MSRVPASAALVLTMAVASGALAQETPRLNDNDLKQLIEEADHGRDRFEDALDGKFKHSIVRGARGEVSVDTYLDDLQENVKRLKERFSPKYAASIEALEVLRQGTDIDGYMKTQPDSMDGQSEWDRFAGRLSALAAAYGTTFPLPPGAAARRINDKETAAAAEEAAKQLDAFKKAVDRDQALPKPQREALKQNADDLADACKLVRARLNDRKPATAEARQMFDGVDGLSEAAMSAGASAATLQTLGPVRATMQKLHQAFGVAPAAPTR